MSRLRLILPMLAPYRAVLAVGFASIAATVAARAFVPTAFGEAVNVLQRDGSDLPGVTLWVIVALVLTALRGAFQYVMRRTIVGTSREFERTLRDRLYESLLRRSPAWLGRHHTGDLMSRLTADVEAVRMSLGPGLMYVATTAFLAPLAFWLMWRMSPLLTLLNLLPLAGIAVAVRALSPRIHQASVDVQTSQGALSTRAQESFAGVRVVKSFARERDEVAAFAEHAEASRDANVRLADTRALFRPVIGLMRGVALALTLGVGGGMMLRRELLVGDFVAFHLYAQMLMWPMISLGWVISIWQRGRVALDRLSALLGDPPQIRDPESPVTRSDAGGALSFRDVSFTYEGASAPALSDVSFEVPAGATVAVVGPTGAGKSTLLALVPRLLDATAGTVSLGGVPVEHLRLAELRRDIGYVPQETFLFSDTIRANVAFGLRDEGDVESVVRTAAEQARVDEEIARLPDGFDSMLGERGVNLSGGQRQRTAISRALAIDPPVLLLDDCLSAVDARTETEILANLAEVLRGRTTLLATHRVSAARLADRIAVLEDGRLTAFGTHEELIEAGGFYTRLATRQSLEARLDAA